MPDESQHFELLPGPEPETKASAETAPALPIEAPLVRAVRALEALKVQADLGLLLLEHCSRDDAQIQAVINGAIDQVNIASAACWQLSHLRSCKGQA